MTVEEGGNGCTMSVTAIVPVKDEGLTVADVVGAAQASVLVDEVLVVDGDSTDDTRERAAAAGARVLICSRRGKGEAMAAGVAATDADVIVFLDGDLTGLEAHHVDRLVRTVTAGSAVMACGLFDRGPLLNPVFLHLLPILTGERALHRELFESLHRADIAGYRIEAALNARAGDLGLPVAAFVCRGMWHRTKEEKYGRPVAGLVAKIRMLTTASTSYVGYWARGRLRSAGSDQRRDGGAAGPRRRTSPSGSSVLQSSSNPGADIDTGAADRRCSDQRSSGRSSGHSSSTSSRP